MGNSESHWPIHIRDFCFNSVNNCCLCVHLCTRLEEKSHNIGVGAVNKHNLETKGKTVDEINAEMMDGRVICKAAKPHLLSEE